MSNVRFFEYLGRSARNSLIVLILIGLAFIIYYLSADQNSIFLFGGLLLVLGGFVFFSITKAIVRANSKDTTLS